MSLVPNQVFDIIPKNSNVKYYKNLGYQFNSGDTIKVKAEDLPNGCKIKIKVQCDCCGKIYEIENKAYQKSLIKHNNHNYCLDCYYGDQSLKKHRQQKIEQGVFDKYGVKNIFQVENIKEKSKMTLIEHFGVDNPMKSQEIKTRAENTNLEKYGYKVALNNPEVYQKAQNSFYSHGTQKCSSQQFELYNMLKDNFNYEECILNKPVSSCSADISLKINNQLIDIEYDGSYWHQTPSKDRARDEIFKKMGYKVLRIKSKKDLPTLVQLQSAINTLLNSNLSYQEIQLSSKKCN